MIALSQDYHVKVSLGNPLRADHPQSSGTTHGDWDPGRPPRCLHRDRLALKDHHKPVTAVISTEIETGHQGEPPPTYFLGEGEGRLGGRTQRRQSVLLTTGEGWPLADPVGGRVLGLRAGHTPVASLLDGLVVAPG